MIITSSPNIAFIKYWGKLVSPIATGPAIQDQKLNLAMNPSISLTLSQAQTKVEIQRLPQNSHGHQIMIDGTPAGERDYKKISKHIARVLEHLNVDAHFELLSRNNFPKGTGLASSASAYSAITLAVIAEILGKTEAEHYLRAPKLQEFSKLARRGSGSACRSVAGGFMKWDGDFAVPLANDWVLYDTIVLLSSAHKKIPSSEGHDLVRKAPSFSRRLQNLPKRIEKVEAALKTKNLSQLGPLIEEEALEFHAVARESGAEYALPETLHVQRAIQSKASRDYFFTVDAGPNIHVISEKPIRVELEAILKNEKIEAEIWEDKRGSGPRIL